jgi:hypothetical protein
LKKILAILLLCCYAISSNGIYISKHFCGGQLETISYYKKVSRCCCVDEEVSVNDDCCNDVASFSKLSTDQEVSNKYLQISNKWQKDVDITQPTLYVLHDIAIAKLLTSAYKVAIPPPPIAISTPLFVQYHCWKLDC